MTGNQIEQAMEPDREPTSVRARVKQWIAGDREVGR